MLRTAFALIATLSLFAMTGWADDKSSEKPKDEKRILVTFVMADVPKSTLTFRLTDKAGKKVELKLPVDKNAKIWNKDDKSETFADFAKSMEHRLEKSIYITEDKDHQRILRIKDIDTF